MRVILVYYMWTLHIHTCFTIYYVCYVRLHVCWSDAMIRQAKGPFYFQNTLIVHLCHATTHMFFPLFSELPLSFLLLQFHIEKFCLLFTLFLQGFSLLSGTLLTLQVLLWNITIAFSTRQTVFVSFCALHSILSCWRFFCLFSLSCSHFI